MSRTITADRLPSVISADALKSAWVETDRFLAELPATFSMNARNFYSILGQRNLSGFVGEVFKGALHQQATFLEPNPHPDGRPDLLDLTSPEAVAHYVEECHEPESNLPIKAALAPFRFGGLEIKCAIGSVRGGSASDYPVGTSRADAVTGLTYWAHHRHACRLVALYYDFDVLDGSPGIKAIFFAEVEKNHWAPVSIGRPDRKKTNNTRLLKTGMDLVKQGLVGYDSTDQYVAMLRRIGARI